MAARTSTEAKGKAGEAAEDPSAEPVGLPRLKALKHEMETGFAGMENVVWWTCSEAQKKSWAVLLGGVRANIQELEAELCRSEQQRELAEQELDKCKEELASLRAHVSCDRLVPPWVPDSDRSSCQGCDAEFYFLLRRHHCRACGDIFCASCTQHYSPVPRLGYDRPVRVCKACNSLAPEASTVSRNLYASSMQQGSNRLDKEHPQRAVSQRRSSSVKNYAESKRENSVDQLKQIWASKQTLFRTDAVEAGSQAA